MPAFRFAARDGAGRAVRGTLAAESRAAVLAALEGRGLRAHDVRPEDPRKGSGGAALSRSDLASVARHLRSLHEAGVPLARGLDAVGRDAGDRALGRALRTLAADIASGCTPCQAVARQGRAFPDAFARAVAAGERGGRLADVLARIESHLLREEELSREVRAATRYPVFVLSFCAAAVVVVFGFALPALGGAYAALAMDPPAITRAMLRFGEAAGSAWPALAAGLVVAVALVVLALRTPAGALAAGRAALAMPGLRTLFGQPAISRFAGLLAVLRRAGIPVPEAFRLAGGSQGNAALRAEAERVAAGVERGGDLATLLAAGPRLPRSMSEAAATASAGADLGDALDDAARRIEETMRDDLRRVGAVAGPVALGLAALVVLALVLSVDLALIERVSAISLAGE